MTTKNGWKCITIKGAPYERGVAYGKACALDFKKIQNMLNFLMMESYGVSWADIIILVSADFKYFTKDNYPELYDEMRGIADGCGTSLDEILAWNFYCSIPYWYSLQSNSHIRKEGGGKDHCSAFMAIGSWTKDGGIVCAHNSFSDFIDGQYSYVILTVIPDKGHSFTMQTSPCWIWSGTDFFITSAGIIGTETTIGGFFPYEKNTPIGYRIREAMQYGNTMDEYCDILLKGNSGDYANSWLFGDIHRKEILRIELGLKYHNIERTKDGFFIGFNAPYDPQIRNLEVVSSGFYDIKRHQGARKVRLGELMKEYKGKLNVEIAKKVLSDHYDVYLHKKNHPCSRTVCSHYELDAREYMSQETRPKPYAPRGAVDGIVCDSTMASRMQFVGRFGNSCGMAFRVDEYCNLNMQYDNFRPYLMDRPSQPWTILPCIKKATKKRIKRKFSKKS